MDSLSRAVGLKIKKGEHEVLGSPFFLLWLSGLSGLLLLRSQLRPARRCVAAIFLRAAADIVRLPVFVVLD